MMFDSSGLEVLGETLGKNSTKCIAGGDTLDYIYRIRSTEVGVLNLTVMGEVDSSYPEECGPEFIIHKRCAFVSAIKFVFEFFLVLETWLVSCC